MLVSRNRNGNEPGFKVQHEYIFYWNINQKAFFVPSIQRVAWTHKRNITNIGSYLHQRLRSRGVQPSLSVLLICLTVISSLNRGDATDIADMPWTLVGVQTVMGISIDIGLKGSVTISLPCGSHDSLFIPHSLSLWAPSLQWSLRKYREQRCLMPHKILTSPFHKRGRTHSIWWANCVWHN